MKLFECDYCSNPVFFENTVCESCQHPLGFLSGENKMFALGFMGDGNWELLNKPGHTYRLCDNHTHNACNWLIEKGGSNFCVACNLNGMIPYLGDPDNLKAWQKFEQAKHRVIYSLLRLGLPIKNRYEDPVSGLEFHFIAESGDSFQAPVTTGHKNGIITINIKEADTVHRTISQEEMKEPYRTLIGHLRHETGHYYWDQLIKNNDAHLKSFRSLFGDETINYADALNRYYNNGPRENWQQDYISAYASSHPWEEWAETWAHYLHIISSMETAYSFGIQVNPKVWKAHLFRHRTDINPYECDDFKKVVDACLPLFYAVNSMNRSMGQADIYPFVLTSSVVEKLCFIHRVIKSSG